MDKKVKSLLLLTLPIILAILISIALQYTFLTQPDKVTAWLSQFGPFVILVYIIVQSITIIIAPLGGFFLQVALIALYKPAIALTLVYLVVTPLYMVNFYIARRFGRPLVAKIVGKNALAQIDRLAKNAGVLTLVILKVFQGGIFDYLSYAIGLTQIPFKTFAIVNIVGGIPGTLVSYYILTRFSNLTEGIIVLIATAYILGIFALLINHQIKKHRA